MDFFNKIASLFQSVGKNQPSPFQEKVNTLIVALGQSPIGKGISGFTEAIANPNNQEPVRLPDPIYNIPTLQGITNMFLNTPLKFGGDIGKIYGSALGTQPAATYQGSQTAPGRLLYDLVGQGGTPQQFASDIAGTALIGLNYLPVGRAGSALGQLGKQGFKETIKQGAIQGGKYGAGYGFLGGIESGRDINDPLSYVGNVAGSALAGGVLGGVTGGTLSGAGYGIQKGAQAYNNMTPYARQAGFADFSAPIGETKYAGSINKTKLNISQEAKKNLDQVTKDIKPELQAIKGKTLTNQEVVEAAQQAQVLKTAVTRDKTLQTTAAIQKLRQQVAAGAEGKGLSKEFIENLKVLNSYAADTGRKLQSFNIQTDPQLGNVKQQVIQQLLKLGQSTDDILKASQGVDWNNQASVTKFYRQFVKPTLPETIDEYRYINLLSSPQTHIVNAFSNILQASVTSPATKLYSGVIDPIASKLSGRQQQHYIQEVPAYYRGSIASLPKAVSGFFDALKGKTFMQRPDINRLPTNAKVLQPLQFVTRALEAGDVFFKTLIKGGEKEALAIQFVQQGKKISEARLDQLADDAANYFIYRKAIDASNTTKQGHVLSWIDAFTNGIYGLRRVPGVGWFIPFVQTPMNILKQGIEYSPAGIVTLAGNADKSQQLAKALVGSTVMLGAGMLAQDSTWSAPTNQKEKELFYSSGRQPYSLLIGDKWVSFSKLGTLAYPIAMATAIKYYTEQSPNALSDDNLTKLSKVVMGMSEFFTDQSYLTGLGDFIKAAQGDQYYARQALANLPSQLVPLTSLVSWVTRMVDPIYRNPDNAIENIQSRIPVLSQGVEPYTDYYGNPSQRQYPILNSFTPLKLSSPDQLTNDIYNQTIQQKQQEKVFDAMIQNPDAATTTQDLTLTPTGDNILDLYNQEAQETAQISKIKKIFELGLPRVQTEQLLQKSGLGNYEDAQYVIMRSLTTENRANVIQEALTLQSSTEVADKLLQKFAKEKVLTTAVTNFWEDQGLISTDQKKELNNLIAVAQGKPGAVGGKKKSLPKPKMPSFKKLNTKKITPKLITLKPLQPTTTSSNRSSHSKEFYRRVAAQIAGIQYGKTRRA